MYKAINSKGLLNSLISIEKVVNNYLFSINLLTQVTQDSALYFPAKFLRKKNYCEICQIEASSVAKAMALIDNCDSYIEFIGQAWLLCQICESYVHWKCYTRLMSLKGKALLEEKEAFKVNKQTYICSKCRIENRADF